MPSLPEEPEEKNIADLPLLSDDNQEWMVVNAECDGSPLIIRLNQTAKGWLAHPELPVRLGFAVPLNSPQEGGLPEPSENQQLNDIEDVILCEVEKRAKGFFAIAMTTGVMKEFVFYIQEGADIRALHETIQQTVGTHDVQCEAEMDPDWEVFQGFVFEGE